MSQQLQQTIEAAWDNRANISSKSAPKAVSYTHLTLPTKA